MGTWTKGAPSPEVTSQDATSNEASPSCMPDRILLWISWSNEMALSLSVKKGLVVDTGAAIVSNIAP